MPDIQFHLTDNSPATLQAFERATKAALEACGQQGASNAKQIIAEAGRIATGAMRNSVSSTVTGKDAYIGTNISYGKFHEMGTGVYIGGGRKTPWAYQGADGEWHWTRGLRPIHFIKNAISNHVAEYREIFRKYLSTL